MVPQSKYLQEVQGLRTVAALLVALYHIWLHRVSGGVDVFFVVAGFFLTAGLMRREPVGPRAILAYYASTLRRVLPGAALVIAATVIVGYLVMPAALWSGQIAHALASMTFTENWQLIADGRSYLQAGLDASPFQQMWALSLQMQAYFLLPLMYLAASLIARLPRVNLRVVLLVLFGIFFLVSFVYSVLLTRSDQPAAYFSSDVRAWEFVAGVLLAVVIDRIVLPKTWARALGLVALAVLVSFGLIVDVSAQFPGFLALLPVLTASAIIIAASNDADIWLLNNKAVTGLADISFGFYLWHWPLLIFLRYLLGGDDVGLWGGLLVIGGAAGLAWANNKLIETPFRRWPVLAQRPLLSVVLSLLLLLPAWGLVQLWDRELSKEEQSAQAELERYLSDPSMELPAGYLVPSPVIARTDLPARYGESCQQEYASKPKTCRFGDQSSGRTIVVVGGSHATQWMPAFVALAERDGHRVTGLTKAGCAFALDFAESASCREWTRLAIALILEQEPDLVVMLGTRKVGGREQILDGFSDIWARLEGKGIRALLLRDNPRNMFDIPPCVGTFGPDSPRCGQPRSEVYSATLPVIEAPNVTFADLSDLFCDAQWCPAVRDGVLLYRDKHHLTRTFVLRHVERIGLAVAAAFDGRPLAE